MSDFLGTPVSPHELLGLIRGAQPESVRELLLTGSVCVGPDNDAERFERRLSRAGIAAEPDEFEAVAQAERLYTHLVGWLGVRHPASHPGRLAAAAMQLTDWATGYRPGEWFGPYRREAHPVEAFVEMVLQPNRHYVILWTVMPKAPE